MGQVCTAARAFDPMLPFLDHKDPITEADRLRLLDWMRKASTTMRTGQGAIAKVHTAPTPAAQSMITTLREALTDKAGHLIHQAGNPVVSPVNKLRAVYTIAALAASPWEEGCPKLRYYLKGHPDLTVAHAHAPPCTATTASPSPTS